MVMRISHEELLPCSLFFLNMSNSDLYPWEESFESQKGQLCSEESVPKWSYVSHTRNYSSDRKKLLYLQLLQSF